MSIQKSQRRLYLKLPRCFHRRASVTVWQKEAWCYVWKKYARTICSSDKFTFGSVHGQNPSVNVSQTQRKHNIYPEYVVVESPLFLSQKHQLYQCPIAAFRVKLIKLLDATVACFQTPTTPVPLQFQMPFDHQSSCNTPGPLNIHVLCKIQLEDTMCDFFGEVTVMKSNGHQICV